MRSAQLKPHLVTERFTAWQRTLQSIDTAPITDATGRALHGLSAPIVTYLAFRRRDVTGG